MTDAKLIEQAEGLLATDERDLQRTQWYRKDTTKGRTFRRRIATLKGENPTHDIVHARKKLASQVGNIIEAHGLVIS